MTGYLPWSVPFTRLDLNNNVVKAKPTRRARGCEESFLSLLIAPAKVLRFLSIALVTTRQDYDWFRGVTRQEFHHRRDLDHHINIVELCNIPVHHCRDAHANRSSRTFVFFVFFATAVIPVLVRVWSRIAKIFAAAGRRQQRRLWWWWCVTPVARSHL